MRIFRKKSKSPDDILGNQFFINTLDDYHIDDNLKKIIAFNNGSLLRKKLNNFLKKQKILNSLNISQDKFENIGRFTYLAKPLNNRKSWLMYECFFEAHKEKLREFVKCRKKIESLLMYGDLDESLVEVNRWIDIYGESIWALRVKSYVLSELGNASGANDLCQSAYDRCGNHFIKVIISRIQSISVSSDTQYVFESTVEPVIKEFEAAGSYRHSAILSGIFCPQAANSLVDISESLLILQFLTVFDVYEFVRLIVINFKSGGNIDSDNMPEDVDGYLCRLMEISEDIEYVNNFDASKVEEYRSDAGKILLSNYENCDYKEVIRIFNEKRKSINNAVAYVNLVGKAKSYLKEKSEFSYKNPLDALVESCSRIYSLDQNAVIAQEEIYSLAIKLNFLRKSSGIYFVGIKCFAAKKIEINDFIKIAAKKTILESKECSNLTVLLGGYEVDAKDQEDSNKSDRLLRKKIIDKIKEGASEETLRKDVENISLGGSLSKDYFEIYSLFCTEFNLLEELVEFSASEICDNSISASCFPMKEMVDCIESKSLDTVSAVIVAHNYVRNYDDSKDVVLNEAFEYFLESKGFRCPSEYLATKEVLDKKEIVFFRDICSIGTLDCLSVFKSGDALRAERIAILDKLFELNCVEASHRRNELEELVAQSIFDAAARQMTGAKIYVDDASIKRRVVDDVRKLLTLFNSIQDDELAVEQLMQIDISAAEDDAASTVPPRAVVTSPKSATVLKMWGVVKKAFIEDEKYGLEKNLSAEIRHGFFSNLIRSNLEEKNLLTEINIDGSYSENKIFREMNPMISPSVLESIDLVFAKFSERISDAIEKAEAWMRMKNEDSNSGIHLYLNNYDLADLTQTVSKTKDPNVIVDHALSFLWSRVNESLETIRNKINTNLRESVIIAFDKLETEFSAAKNNLHFSEMVSKIQLARTDFIADVSVAAGWFYKSNQNKLPASSLDYLIDIAIKAFERVNSFKSSSLFEVSGGVEEIVSEDAAKPLVIALINLFDNCIMHSGYYRATNIKINSYADDFGMIFIEISNEVSQQRRCQFTDEYLELINGKAKSEESKEYLKLEGGSGTIKAYREIFESFNISDMRFEFDDSIFKVTINYAR